MALRSLIVNLEARTAAFESALNRADRQIAGFERSMAKVQRGLAFAATAGGLAIAAKKIFDLGAAVEDAKDRFETTFGASAQAVEKFGQSFGQMAGLSQRATQELLASTGAVAQGMGFAEAASAALAQQVTQLAGDLAEFRGVDTATVVQQLTAALAGQTRGLKEYGILISEADVQQRAFAETGKVVADTLTDQERATATLHLVTERMGKATGELARSQDEAGVKAARIRAQFQDLADDVALRMLPAIQEMLPALEALIPPLTKLVDLLAKFANGMVLLIPGQAAATDAANARLAEQRSLANVGPRALGGVRDRFNAEIAARLPEVARLQGERDYLLARNLPTGSFDRQIAKLVTEIRTYGELIATVNVRLTEAASASTTIARNVQAQVGTWTGRPVGLGITDVGGQAAAAFGVRSAPLGRRFQGDEGLASPFAVVPQSFDELAKATQGAEEANDALTMALNQGVQAFGAMVQAVAYGSATMEQAVTSAIFSMIQAAIQLKAQQLGSWAGPLGTIVGTIGGLIVSSMADRPQPVRLVDVTDGAAGKINRARSGPDVVQIVVTDRAGNITSTVDVLRRQIRLDAQNRFTAQEVAVA